MGRFSWQFDKDFWKTDWFIGLAVTVVFVLAAAGTTLQGIERAFYDFTITLTAERPAINQVTLVQIDEDTVARAGTWPISPDVLAAAIHTITQAQPKVVGLALDLQQIQNARGTQALADLREMYDIARPGDMSGEFSRKLDAKLREAENKADGERVLTQVVEKAGNVILGIPYRIRRDLASANPPPLPPALARFALSLSSAETSDAVGTFAKAMNPPAIPIASMLRLPADGLTKVAAGVGHFQPNVDIDGRVRFERLVVGYQDKYLPSLSLRLAAAGMGVSLDDVRVVTGEGIGVGGQWLDTDKSQRLMPYFYKRTGDKRAFETVSFQSVLELKASPALFRDHVVIIGLTHFDLVDPVVIPTGETVAPAELVANTVASILNGDYYRVPDWSWWAEVLAILLVASYLVSFLPRISLGFGLAVSAILAVVLVNAYVIVMVAQGIWLQLITPTLQLLVGHTIFGIKRAYEELAAQGRTENAEANRMLGLAYQSQGQMDLAFDKFRKCPIDDALLELLYSLGQDYERKRQFSRAAAVFRYITSRSPEFRDAKKRVLSNNEVAGARVSAAPGSASAHGTLVLKNNGVQKPMLGRYEIEKELGRGAMGMVYLGRDPKIGRTVAIKTMALSQEFDDVQLVEVKERFFREASTAGRLNHPNIVTIYDVGEEHDLAYIAMDYLEGVNLTPYTQAENLLPLNEIFLVIGKMAEALDYAHENQVVHRDIKPANVVYNAAKRQVTVMDFGVAFLVDANKTKTGSILGTPSYMSPEQLAGQKVDGRSDLFSLGVMFFQLATGELPFIGESIATLLYKIANEKHPDPRMFRPDLPVCVGRVIDKALRKEIDQRFQSGRQLAAALKKCQAIIDSSKREPSRQDASKQQVDA